MSVHELTATTPAADATTCTGKCSGAWSTECAQLKKGGCANHEKSVEANFDTSGKQSVVGCVRSGSSLGSPSGSSTSTNPDENTADYTKGISMCNEIVRTFSSVPAVRTPSCPESIARAGDRDSTVVVGSTGHENIDAEQKKCQCWKCHGRWRCWRQRHNHKRHKTCQWSEARLQSREEENCSGEVEQRNSRSNESLTVLCQVLETWPFRLGVRKLIPVIVLKAEMVTRTC